MLGQRDLNRAVPRDRVQNCAGLKGEMPGGKGLPSRDPEQGNRRRCAAVSYRIGRRERSGMTATQQNFVTRQPSGAADELRRLLGPQGRPQSAIRHEVILRRGAASENLCLLQHGWAVARGLKQNGRAAILRIYLPGDVIGLTDLGLGQVQQDVVMLTEGLVHVVPKSVVAGLARHNQRLWPLLLALSNGEVSASQTRAILLDCATAEDRLIHLLLDLRGRLAVEGVGDGNRFPLPMNQTEIGEATGMTGIYVNRLIGKMVRDRQIEVQRPYVRLLERANFENRIEAIELAPTLDVGWALR